MEGGEPKKKTKRIEYDQVCSETVADESKKRKMENYDIRTPRYMDQIYRGVRDVVKEDTSE